MTWDWRWSYVTDHWDLFGTLLTQHIYMALVAVLLGLVISVPLGVLCLRFPPVYPVILGLTSALYALPSLALFVLLINYTGFSPWTVIIPLTVYSTSVLVRNVVDGLRAVPDHVRQAAIAMGFSTTRRLVLVELPIAVPVIFAGLRVATVANISLASVGSAIGIAGLGQLFTDGQQRNFATPIVVGIVLTILLAVVADALLVLGQYLLTPWSRSRGARA